MTGFRDFRKLMPTNPEWEHLFLLQDDGLWCNLIYRFHEIKLSFPNKSISVSYHISEVKMTEDELIKNHLKKVFGQINGEFGYEKGHVYSEMTSDPDYYWSSLEIGGHNLKAELREQKDRFLRLTVLIN